MSRLGLIVGIDHYNNSQLTGCVNDALQLNEVLSKNYDSSPNFACKLLISSNGEITRSGLKGYINQLFSSNADMAVFYFAGHGTANNLGGYIVTQDAEKYDEGVPMLDILTMANQSSIREAVIMLDCCHSGAFGAIPTIANDKVLLREGVSVLCASRATEPAIEQGGSGIFSALVCEALYGGASNLIGDVTVADVYSFVSRNLGPWDQTPLFKCHVSKLIPLRRCDPTIDRSTLRLLPKYFKSPDDEFRLNPSYEFTSPSYSGKETGEIFDHLKTCRAAGLLMPVGEVSMYSAAINSKSCRLTKLGQYYWNLAQGGRL
jgi:hypothetical protein